MLSDLDRYYTPQSVALRAVEQVQLSGNPKSCADSTCGTGRLLEAANEVFGDIRCIGIDRDKQVIAALRRRRPTWTLSARDLLSMRAHPPTFPTTVPKRVDLLLMNPPFSQQGRKHVDITYEGEHITGSVAMAYILRSFELFKPARGGVLIVPESLMYSETDSIARAALSRRYHLQKIADLRSCTFKGARAHASVIQAMPHAEKAVSTARRSSETEVRVRVIRGNLPVHAMVPVGRGIPYVHSTDLRDVIRGSKFSGLARTADDKRRVEDWALLIPRVGMPQPSLVQAIRVDVPIRLSDCVIALECASKAAAVAVERRIKASWSEFQELYKGTGARYTTLARLQSWLATKNIIGFIEEGG